MRQAVKRGMPVIAIARDEVSEAEAQAFPTVKWLQCDLADTDAVLALAQRNRIDACIHAAAISNEAYARPDPRGAIATNVGATANLLEAARLASWRRFVLISTGSVFSAQQRHDKTDRRGSGSWRRQRLQYDQALRRTANAHVSDRVRPVCRDSAHLLGVRAADHQRSADARADPVILLRALQGIAIREGGADFAASFTYVADAAGGLLAAATAPELRHPTYHLGHGVNFTAGEAAAAVRSAVPGAVIELTGGTEPWTRYTRLRGPLAGDRLRADTGYSPTHTLEAGVRAYADWMRAQPYRGGVEPCGTPDQCRGHRQARFDLGAGTHADAVRLRRRGDPAGACDPRTSSRGRWKPRSASCWSASAPMCCGGCGATACISIGTWPRRRHDAPPRPQPRE